MKREKLTAKILILVFLCMPFLISCAGEDALDRIEKSGEITVLTQNNAHCSYTYRDPWDSSTIWPRHSANTLV
ncbi:MAG: hypothetical protein JRH09_05670 [Deltaproteobacteria bacterium]|nr:hypothetical protein [Deltaproteobacteria bacterium]